MVKFGAVKFWHKFLNTMAKFDTKFPDHVIRTSIHTELSQQGYTMQYFNN